MNQTSRQNLIITLFLFLAILFLWDSVLLFPYRLFVVFLHEFSHALAAWLTGGSVVSMSLNMQEGGLAITRGGSRFLILNAGYLGSLVLGGGLLYWAALSNRDEIITMTVGVLTIGLTLLLVRPFISWGFLFGVLFGTGLFLAGYNLPTHVNDILVRLIGLTSCLYVLLDIKSDVFSQSHLPSDARMLAIEYGGTTWLWGGIWLLMAVVIVYWIISLSLRAPAQSKSIIGE